MNVRRVTRFLVVTLLIEIGTLAESLAAQGVVERDFYFANGQRIAVDVALDRIGVLAAGDDAEAEAEIADLASRLGFTVKAVFPGSLIALSIPQGAAERSALLRLARTIRMQGGDAVRDSGLLLTARGSEDRIPALLTDEFIAQFTPDTTAAEIENLNTRHHVRIVNPTGLEPNQFVLAVTEESEIDALRMANRYHALDVTYYAEPNLSVIRNFLQQEVLPNDPYFDLQWHLRNTGQGGGTIDADADLSWAWSFGLGDPDTVIAIYDSSVDILHGDLTVNRFRNGKETANNNLDDDNNTYVDDINGWDFTSCKASAPPGCGDNNPNPDNPGDAHGTAVAGIAAGFGNNKLGIVGACPLCYFLPIRSPLVSSVAVRAAGFRYARIVGADIVNNSWGHASSAGIVSTTEKQEIDKAVADGIVVLFGAGNIATDKYCDSSYPSLENVIAVSSSNNFDTRGQAAGWWGLQGAAIGNCIDVLAPSFHGGAVLAGEPGLGGQPSEVLTTGVTTTDQRGSDGYNSGGSNAKCKNANWFWLKEHPDPDYTNCFGGTSSATPLVAGTVGLLLSSDPSLTPQEIQRLLQDTADKVDPDYALYSPRTGFSSPPSGVSLLSWGRLNAFEAVRLVAPSVAGGRSRTDLFIRDNDLDWGNATGYPRPYGQEPGQSSNVRFAPIRGYIAHWESPDIKVDAPPYSRPLTTSGGFDAHSDENPIAGAINRVYVRVRNRGPDPAVLATVGLFWAHAGTALPTLPRNFWKNFGSASIGTTAWHPLGTRTIAELPYSGASQAGCPGRAQPACAPDETDAARIVSFDFELPPIEPPLTSPDHFSLLAIVEARQDHVDPRSRIFGRNLDRIVPNDNSIAVRNRKILFFPASQTTLLDAIFVRNPFVHSLDVKIEYETELSSLAPKSNWKPLATWGWSVQLPGLPIGQPVTLQPFEERLVPVQIMTPYAPQPVAVNLELRQIDVQSQEVIGGVTYTLRPSSSAP